jgi:hypothetical protein
MHDDVSAAFSNPCHLHENFARTGSAAKNDTESHFDAVYAVPVLGVRRAPFNNFSLGGIIYWVDRYVV